VRFTHREAGFAGFDDAAGPVAGLIAAAGAPEVPADDFFDSAGAFSGMKRMFS